MKKRTTLSAVAAGFGLIGFAFILAAVCTNGWLSTGVSNSGLWRECSNGICEDLVIGRKRSYENYEMVRGFGVLTVAMALLGTVVTVMDIVIKKKIEPSVMATLFLMAAFFGLTCISLFTSLSISGSSDKGFGYSFALGWASFPATLVAGLIMTYLELAC